MDAKSYSYVRSHFVEMMEKVCDDHEELIITRQNHESVIMISLADYNSMRETLHVVSSIKNAKMLAESIEQMKNGEVVEMDIDEFLTKKKIKKKETA